MNVFEAAAQAVERGVQAALVTVIGTAGSTPRTSGARMLVRADGSSVGTIGGGAIERTAQKLALEVIAAGSPRRHHSSPDDRAQMGCGGDMELYIEPLRPQPELLLFGAGHVARETAPLIRRAGFRVRVIDDRAELAIQSGFPDCTVVVADPVEVARTHPVSETTHALLMTHLHQRDRELLEVLIQRPHRWIGMLGSKVKVNQIMAHLGQQGIGEQLLASVRAPVGLDIAAETPFEIAVSVVSQLVSETRGAARPIVAMCERPEENPLRPAAIAPAPAPGAKGGDQGFGQEAELEASQ